MGVIVDILFIRLLERVFLFFCSYAICTLSKNKVVSFVFGSFIGFSVLIEILPPRSDVNDTLAGLLLLGVIGFSFFTGYAIAKATK